MQTKHPQIIKTPNQQNNHLNPKLKTSSNNKQRTKEPETNQNKVNQITKTQNKTPNQIPTKTSSNKIQPSQSKPLQANIQAQLNI